MGERRIQALVLDLDDTIADTFSTLIEPLEREAAAAMLAAGAPAENAASLAALLLDLRRSHPGELEAALARRLAGLPAAALEARRSVLARIPVERLAMVPRKLQVLRDLGSRYRLFLLTVGDPAVQRAKVERLGIAGLFERVMILDEDVVRDKAGALDGLIRSAGLAPDEVAVVGNRLDGEIRAGISLGARTVWVMAGEGSAMRPDAAAGRPDVVIDGIEDLPEVLEKLG